MSSRKNPYLFYTEYYLISGAYQVINVVNGILTYSACYSDNIKEYLRNQVESKQVAWNELIRNNECNTRVNVNNASPDNDVDEDGFVVIKMRKPKTKIIKTTNEELLSKMKTTENENNNIKDHAIDDAIIKDIIEEMMSRF
jgi:signal recognition particle subunit SEC65